MKEWTAEGMETGVQGGIMRWSVAHPGSDVAVSLHYDSKLKSRLMCGDIKSP